MKYLIVGLGNIGTQYVNTRHNVGFLVLDSLAKAYGASFEDKRYGFVTEIKHRARSFVLLKPSTYVNRSGLAVNYWSKKTKVPVEKLLVVTDDLSLPFGKIRLRPKGSDAGHNGLANIIQVLGHQNFARLRFGIGNDYRTGQQVDYVLGKWGDEEKKFLPERIEICIEIIASFGTIGLERTMNLYNNK